MYAAEGTERQLQPLEPVLRPRSIPNVTFNEPQILGDALNSLEYAVQVAWKVENATIPKPDPRDHQPGCYLSFPHYESDDCTGSISYLISTTPTTSPVNCEEYQANVLDAESNLFTSLCTLGDTCCTFAQPQSDKNLLSFHPCFSNVSLNEAVDQCLADSPSITPVAYNTGYSIVRNEERGLLSES
jgi:hypothetical protein